MIIYWLTVEIGFKVPMPSVDDNDEPDGEAMGFFRQLGVTMEEDADVDEWVREYLSQDEAVKVGDQLDLDVAVIEADKLQAEILDDDELTLCGDPLEDGLWFESERAFYSADDSE